MLGEMTRQVTLVVPAVTHDAYGFPTATLQTVATIRAYREGRHGSEDWRNRAAFTDATDLYRFRAIPGQEITTDMVIIDGSDKMEITSVELLRGHGLYVEVLTKVVKPSGES